MRLRACMYFYLHCALQNPWGGLPAVIRINPKVGNKPACACAPARIFICTAPCNVLGADYLR
jgi:hypothetical protein